MNPTAAPASVGRTAVAAASVPLAVCVLDAMAVPVLLPSIRLDLGSSSSGAQWVENAYLLGLAAPLPLLAWVAQLMGARVVAAGGALVVAAGAVVCAAAESTAVLVTGRAAAGVGAGALLAALARSLPGGAGRAAAAAALPALAVVLGPLVGGLFAEQDWWRLFFWAGVPLAVAAAVPVLLVTTRERGEPVPGAVRLAIFAAALIAVTIAFVQVEPWGWGWTGFVVVLATGAVLRLVSPWRSHLPPAAASWFALAGCLATLAFLLPQYFELARGLSPLRGAVLTLTLAVPAVAGWALGWRASGRLGLRTLSLGGYACAALGLAALGTLDADSRYALIVLALVLVGSGLGLAAGAVWSTPVTESLGGRVAAALTGASLGLAMAGAGFQQAQADERGAGASFEQALAVGVGWAALLLIALLAAAAPQAWRLGRRDR